MVTILLLFFTFILRESAYMYPAWFLLGSYMRYCYNESKAILAVGISIPLILLLFTEMYHKAFAFISIIPLSSGQFFFFLQSFLSLITITMLYKKQLNHSQYMHIFYDISMTIITFSYVFSIYTFKSLTENMQLFPINVIQIHFTYILLCGLYNFIHNDSQDLKNIKKIKAIFFT